MKTKKFRGEIIGIEDSSFTDEKGEMISGARLKIMLNDEKGLNIFISEKRDKKIFDALSSLDIGQIIDIAVNVDVKNSGALKFIPLELTPVGDATSDLE